MLRGVTRSYVCIVAQDITSLKLNTATLKNGQQKSWSGHRFGKAAVKLCGSIWQGEVIHHNGQWTRNRALRKKLTVNGIKVEIDASKA